MSRYWLKHELRCFQNISCGKCSDFRVAQAYLCIHNFLRALGVIVEVIEVVVDKIVSST